MRRTRRCELRTDIAFKNGAVPKLQLPNMIEHPDCDRQNFTRWRPRHQDALNRARRARRGREPRDGGSCPNPLACQD